MLQILHFITAIGALVCFIMIVVKMFQHGKTLPAVLSILFSCICVGPFIALVYGWMKAGEWNIKNLMIAYSVCLAANLGIGSFTLPETLKQIQMQLEQQPGMNKPGVPPVIEPARPVEVVPGPAPAPAPVAPAPGPAGEPAPTPNP